jgi:hypothetical protein
MPRFRADICFCHLQPHTLLYGKGVELKGSLQRPSAVFFSSALLRSHLLINNNQIAASNINIINLTAFSEFQKFVIDLILIAA